MPKNDYQPKHAKKLTKRQQKHRERDAYEFSLVVACERAEQKYLQARLAYLNVLFSYDEQVKAKK